MVVVPGARYPSFMAVSSLREVTIGVQDLHTRTKLFESGCGLSVLESGRLASMTAARLFETQIGPNAAILGRLRRGWSNDLAVSKPRGNRGRKVA